MPQRTFSQERNKVCLSLVENLIKVEILEQPIHISHLVRRKSEKPTKILPFKIYFLLDFSIILKTFLWLLFILSKRFKLPEPQELNNKRAFFTRVVATGYFNYPIIIKRSQFCVLWWFDEKNRNNWHMIIYVVLFCTSLYVYL